MKLSIKTGHRSSYIFIFILFSLLISGCNEGENRDDLLRKIDSVKNHYNNSLNEGKQKLYLANRHNTVFDSTDIKEYIVLRDRKIPIITRNGTRNGKYTVWINDNGNLEEIKAKSIKFTVDSSFDKPMYRLDFEQFDVYLDKDKINDINYLKEAFERIAKNGEFDIYGYVSNLTMYSRDQENFKIRIYDTKEIRKHSEEN